MKILLGMNLSPQWVRVINQSGWDAVHWSEVGDIHATDANVMAWARENGYVIITHDLDFGMLLALTQAVSPSVVQVRAQDIGARRVTDIGS